MSILIVQYFCSLFILPELLGTNTTKYGKGFNCKQSSQEKGKTLTAQQFKPTAEKRYTPSVTHVQPHHEQATTSSWHNQQQKQYTTVDQALPTKYNINLLAFEGLSKRTNLGYATTQNTTGSYLSTEKPIKRVDQMISEKQNTNFVNCERLNTSINRETATKNITSLNRAKSERLNKKPSQDCTATPDTMASHAIPIRANTPVSQTLSTKHITTLKRADSERLNIRTSQEKTEEQKNPLSREKSFLQTLYEQPSLPRQPIKPIPKPRKKQTSNASLYTSTKPFLPPRPQPRKPKAAQRKSVFEEDLPIYKSPVPEKQTSPVKFPQPLGEKNLLTKATSGINHVKSDKINLINYIKSKNGGPISFSDEADRYHSHIDTLFREEVLTQEFDPDFLTLDSSVTVDSKLQKFINEHGKAYKNLAAYYYEKKLGTPYGTKNSTEFTPKQNATTEARPSDEKKAELYDIKFIQKMNNAAYFLLVKSDLVTPKSDLYKSMLEIWLKKEFCWVTPLTPKEKLRLLESETKGLLNVYDSSKTKQTKFGKVLNWVGSFTMGSSHS